MTATKTKAQQATPTSAYERLEELRARAVEERVRARAIQERVAQAERDAQRAQQDLATAYADDNPEAVDRARDAEDEALRLVQEFSAQLSGANIRVERAQADVERYLREHAPALLDERVAVAEQVTHDLIASVRRTLELHRALIDERTEQDRILAGSGANPRMDGPEPTHPWEQALSTLARVVRETPSIDPPKPRWLARREAAERDRVARLLQQQRQG